MLVAATVAPETKREPSRRVRVRRRVRPVTAVTVAKSDLLPAAVPIVAPIPLNDAPFLFVAATGDATHGDESLHIAVRTGVPDTEPGRAEAAAVQTLTVATTDEPAAPIATVPVWTNVAIETGQEPVMTLTALR